MTRSICLVTASEDAVRPQAVFGKRLLSGRLLSLQTMSNHHWVCFQCREAARRPGIADNVRCSGCGSTCVSLGTKVPAPPKSKLAVWKALETDYFARRRAWGALVRQRAVRKKHDIEREILKVEGLPDNEGRRSLLKQLKADLDSVSVRCL